jgi:hypothetical protein
MTRSEEKLITFKDLLNLVIHQIRLYLSHPDPEMRGLIHHFPRIISNTVFDNTSGIEFCIQKVYHQNGKFLKREENKDRIVNLKKQVKEMKKEVRQKSFKKHKGKYAEEVQSLQTVLKMAEVQLQKSKELVPEFGLIDFMKEHVTGREQASKYILDYILQNDLTMDVEKTKEVLKKFCFTIQLEKIGNTHTKANFLLEDIQRGNTTFDDYEKIITELGYQELSEELRPRFEAAKIELKYFKK